MSTCIYRSIAPSQHCVCACAVLVLELWIPSYATAEATVCTQPDPHEGRELFLVLLHPPRARVEAAAAR